MLYFKISLFLTPLIAISWLFYDNQVSIEKLKNLTCTELLNESYLKNTFEGITISPLSEYRQKSNTDQSCRYTFSRGDRYYEASLTLGVLGDATIEMFESSVMTLESRKFMMGWGEKAYMYPLGLAHEVTIYSKENFIHGYILEERNETLLLDKKLTKKFLHEILEKLDLS